MPDSQPTPRSSHRPRVALVTSYWGDEPLEAVEATRLIAGALARHADITVVHLSDAPPAMYTDSVFDVHRVTLRNNEPTRAALLRAALSKNDNSASVPTAALELLREYEGSAPGVAAAIDAINPVSVVLAGTVQPWDLATLGARLDDGRRRVVTIPFCSDRALMPDELTALIDVADVVGTIHPGEINMLKSIRPDRIDDIVEIDLALGSNPHARSELLAGISDFGEYVLLVRSHPFGGPREDRAVGREMLRDVLGDVAVAEIDDNGWWMCDSKSLVPIPVSHNRINFARLVAHARATVDVRPAGPVGRLAIESMLYGVPVVVSDKSAAREHAESANGGLWYRDDGELFDAVRAIALTPLGERLAAQAQTYAQKKHGDLDAFVARMGTLVLGSGELARA